MNQQRLTIALLGSGGGVAKAVLALLNRSAGDSSSPLHRHLAHCRIHCVDLKQRPKAYYREHCPLLSRDMSLHTLDANDTSLLKKLLKRIGASLVIDLSWADTVSVLSVCDELGIAYANTALENKEVDEMQELEGFTLIERFIRFEEARGGFTRAKAIISSGMNPGVVQWMALKLRNAYPDEQPIGCYIVESDDTFYADPKLAEERTIYSTWAPECFLDEALLNYPMLASGGVPLFLYNHVYDLRFRVKLGAHLFHGCLMPHEEALTLSRLLGVESGFLYKVSNPVTAILRQHREDSDELWSWKHQLLDPNDAPLDGADLVGVLLVYPDKERYMYNVMRSDEVAPVYGTNATYLQVACGVYGAVCALLLDEINTGVYWVDELLLNQESRYGDYLSYYMAEFVTGENDTSDGLLLQRMRDWPEGWRTSESE
ncbi:S-adenosylmethionine decarboxylase related protein [Paenibacillus spongiae]|uniref:S-adenosylmethionine decarboxylase related protein n=1 Tax=Paenibacillus spongiae TaxID=2909671 RepID=A0ABY5SBC2_9BACL|nr:S-adenosylmethionine decarboxylase related protein [Paenibacillus spongiae]UVI30830.1 S-adenosylmethionine decarboxylase related protein [Paenibacillus spongiae]